jgi:ATP-dependent DNA helicase RecG
LNEIGLKPNMESIWNRYCFYINPNARMSVWAPLKITRHPAWQSLKAEELLAQQISQLQAKRARASPAARQPVLQPRPQPFALDPPGSAPEPAGQHNQASCQDGLPTARTFAGCIAI